LVAARKARPRYAEGPLRDEGYGEPEDGQLRIFEVDPAQISTEPEPVFDDSQEPQWTSIWLDTPPERAQIERGAEQSLSADAVESYAYPEMAKGRLPQLAPIGRRVLAASINAGIVLAGTLAFAAGFVVTTRHEIPWETLGSVHGLLSAVTGHSPVELGLQPGLMVGAVAAAAIFLCLLYEALFFSLSGATPGMRCARIALCTFDDNNPTRKAVRRRMFALLFSTLPLGLGFLWATIDEERLAWHDRLCRMYQRSY
jgi:hypothetical protein